MKKIIIFGIVLLILSNLAAAFDIKIYNENMEENYLFSPGDKITVEAIAETANANFELLFNNMDSIISAAMNKIEENKFQFSYNIPENIGKGNYLVKITTDNLEEIREIVVGNIINMQFVDPDNEDSQELETTKNILKAKLERKDYSVFQKIIMIAKNIWVNYIWIKE